MATPAAVAAVLPLLQAMLSPAALAQGEASYNALLASAGAGEVAEALLEAVATQQQGGAETTAVRSLAVVLVRRIIDKRNAAWAALPDPNKARVRQALWRAFAAEGDGAVLRALAHAVAKASDGWADLLPGLLQMLGATQDAARQAAVFFLLEQMAEFSSAFTTDGATTMNSVGPALQTALAGGSNEAAVAPMVRAAAVRAWLALLTNVQAAHLLAVGNAAASASSVQLSAGAEALEPLAPLALQAVAAMLEAGNEGAEAQEAVLTALAECVENAPKVFQPHLEGLLQLMMQLASEADADASLRRQAVEVLLTCCGACPGSVRKINGFPEAFLTLCMTLCAEPPADEAEALREWGSKMDLTPSGEAPEGGDDAEEGCAWVAEPAIYRLMGALGGKTMLPIAMRVVPQWMGVAGPEWGKRRAGLVVVAAMVDYCPKQIKASFAQMFKTAVDFSKDAHPRVAAEALHLITLLAAKFPEIVVQGTHVADALPALGTAILNEDGHNRPPRLRGIAVSTLTALLANERVTAAHLAGLTDPLLSALAACLQPSQQLPPAVQEATLEAVAAIATVTQADFAEKHYAGFMPGLKGILASASALAQGNAASLRDRAIECVGVVGAAVGRALFAPDAVEVMDLLVGQLQSVQLGDVSFERMGPATGTVCQALGEGFMRYLPVLVPLLAKTTQLDDGFSVEDAADEEEDGVITTEAGGHSTVLELRGVGKKRVTLNTFAMQEKAAALDTLDRYARVLGWRFAEHAEALPELLLPLLACPHSEQVRTSAALCMASTFDCLVLAARRGLRPPQQAQALLLRYLPPITDKLETERQHEGRAYMAQAARDMLRSCAESGGVDPATGRYREPMVKLSSVEARAMCIKARDGMIQSLARRGEAERRFEEDDQLEDEDYEAILEEVSEEGEVMSHLTDCCGYLIKAERAAFVPTMDAELLPLLQALLGLNNPAGTNKNPATLVANAVCLFDDAIEYCGPAAHKYLGAFLPVLVHALDRATPGTTNNNKAANQNQEEEAEEEEEGDLAVLCQASVYGITQACKHAPEHLDKALAPLDILPRLLRLLKLPTRNEEPQRAPTENAVSALLSICRATLSQRMQAPLQLLGTQGAKGALPSLPAVLGLCLGHMPLYDDVVEARVVHRQLADLMEAAMTTQPQLLGVLLGAEQGYQNAPLLVQAVAATVKMGQTQLAKAREAGGEEEEEEEAVAEPVTVARLGNLLQKMSGQGGAFGVPPEVWSTAYARLDEGAKAALQKSVAAN